MSYQIHFDTLGVWGLGKYQTSVVEPFYISFLLIHLKQINYFEVVV